MSVPLIPPLSLAASLAPVIPGILKYRRGDPADRALTDWLALGFLISGTQALLAIQGIRTVRLIFMAYPVFLLLALRAFVRLEGRSPGRWLAASGYALFALVWLFAFARGEASSMFQAMSGPVVAIVMTGVAGWLLVSTTSRVSGPLMRDRAFLVGTGTLCAYAPAAAIWPLSQALFDSDPGLVRNMWDVRGLLLIVGYLILTKAMLWRPQPGN